MHKLSGKPKPEILAELRRPGLGSLPGGGAEVFADRVRQADRPGQGASRTSGSRPTGPPTRWACRPTARCSTATSRTTRSGSTTCCGCATCRTRRAASWPSSRCRSTPRTRCSSGAAGGSRPASTTSRCSAVSRLMLDNFPNIKAYWIMISTPLAQIALHYGANDIQGTVMEEKIAHAAGAVTPQEEKINDLVGADPRGRPHARAARHALQPGAAVLIRLGRISYANMAPVFYELDGDGVEQVSGVPTSSTGCCWRARSTWPDLLDRVCPQRRPAAAAAPAVRLGRGRRRLDPADHPQAAEQVRAWPSRPRARRPWC